MPPKHHKKKGFYGGKKTLNDFDSIQGILFTCNGSRQREASQEALGLVEQFGDKVVETSDTLQNDILEIMTKEREKQIVASKKKQERINARISRGGTFTDKANVATTTTTGTTPGANKEEPKETIENVDNSKEQVDTTTNLVIINNEEPKQTVETTVEEKKTEEAKQEIEKSTEDKPVEISTTTITTTEPSSDKTTATNNEINDSEMKQQLTTWQLKEKNKTPETGLDLSTILSCEFLETEVKIVKDGTKNYELLETGVSGQIFVRVRNRLISPVAICQKISKHFKKAFDNQEEISSRFLFKMFPICDMFQANENNLSNRFPKMIENKLDKTKSVRYVVNIKSHHNNTLDKKIIYETISQKIPNGSVELNHAPVEFHVFLTKGKCLLGLSTECDIFNYNINAMRHTSTQDEILKENQRNASKRKANEILTESSLEVADMIEVENSKNNEPSEKEDETMEDNTNPSSTVEADTQISSAPTEGNEQEMYEFLEEPVVVPVVESTVSLEVYSKRRKVQNHPTLEFDDIKVI